MLFQVRPTRETSLSFFMDPDRENSLRRLFSLYGDAKCGRGRFFGHRHPRDLLFGKQSFRQRLVRTFLELCESGAEEYSVVIPHEKPVGWWGKKTSLTSRITLDGVIIRHGEKSWEILITNLAPGEHADAPEQEILQVA